MWRKQEQLLKKEKKRSKVKFYTENQHVILASSSKTRINYLRRYFRKATAVKHKVDEIEIKKKNKSLSFEELVKLLAKKKARIRAQLARGTELPRGT